jgi:hypothetical protein
MTLFSSTTQAILDDYWYSSDSFSSTTSDNDNQYGSPEQQQQQQQQQIKMTQACNKMGKKFVHATDSSTSICAQESTSCFFFFKSGRIIDILLATDAIIGDYHRRLDMLQIEYRYIFGIPFISTQYFDFWDG